MPQPTLFLATAYPTFGLLHWSDTILLSMIETEAVTPLHRNSVHHENVTQKHLHVSQLRGYSHANDVCSSGARTH